MTQCFFKLVGKALIPLSEKEKKKFGDVYTVAPEKMKAMGYLKKEGDEEKIVVAISQHKETLIHFYCAEVGIAVTVDELKTIYEAISDNDKIKALMTAYLV